MTRKILAPHKEQDGWVYVRVPRSYLGTPSLFTREVPPLDDSSPAPMKLYKYVGLDEYEVGYPDDTPGSRIISSRRVEEAVYQADRAREAGFTLKGAVNLYKWLNERGTDIGEAVETDDFLKLCAEEGLYASYWPDGEWLVSTGDNKGSVATGTTLREAYYRYKAEAELDAQQLGPFGDETEPVDDETEPPVICYYCEHFHKPSYSEPCLSCIEHGRDDNGNWSRPFFERAAR